MAYVQIAEQHRRRSHHHRVDNACPMPMLLTRPCLNVPLDCRVVGKYPRVVRSVGNGDVGEPCVDEFGMDPGVHVHENPSSSGRIALGVRSPIGANQIKNMHRG